MERPFVVCHMLASLDGKIDGEFFGLPQAAQAIKTYEELRSFYGCQATLYGTTTMLGGYSDGKAGKLPPAESDPPRADWVNPAGKTMGNFIVAVDPKGELAYSAPTIEKKGRPAAHVIEVLTQQASSDYLAYLQGLGVSYLFAGQDRLDCTLLLRKLYRLFAIDRLMLAGGGIVSTGHFWLRAWWTNLAWSSPRWSMAARAQILSLRRIFCPISPQLPSA